MSEIPSMAAPNVTGSIALLLQHYKNTHSGYVPLSSTVKAILIHSADESVIILDQTINMAGVC